MEALPEEQIDELIELLRQYELSIAALYDTFARLLVSDGQTWTKFANEERLHAKWISAHKNEKLHVTISIGATLVRKNDNSKGILKRADQLLYRSKESGRNCLTID